MKDSSFCFSIVFGLFYFLLEDYIKFGLILAVVFQEIMSALTQFDSEDLSFQLTREYIGKSAGYQGYRKLISYLLKIKICLSY